MIVKIPIKPHLKKFILKTYRSKEPIDVREDDKIIGASIMSILIDKRSRKSELPQIYSGDVCTEILKIKLSDVMRKHSPSIKKLIHLNQKIDDLFKQALYIWVQACIDCGVNPYNATRGFVEFYEFDEKEYKHDAAQRAWLRYKNKEYEKVKKKAQLRHKKSATAS